MAGSCEHSNEPLVSLRRGIAWLSFQDGLCSVVIYYAIYVHNLRPNDEV